MVYTYRYAHTLARHVCNCKKQNEKEQKERKRTEETHTNRYKHRNIQSNIRARKILLIKGRRIANIASMSRGATATSAWAHARHSQHTALCWCVADSCMMC